MLELKDFYDDQIILRQVKRAAAQAAAEMEEDEDEDEAEEGMRRHSVPDIVSDTRHDIPPPKRARRCANHV